MRLRKWILVDLICMFCDNSATAALTNISSVSLTDLDLRNNRVVEVRNLHNLSRLEHLNLGKHEEILCIRAIADICR